jgi:cytochrome c-type biogenesis protein CcmH/NrfF
MNRLRILSKIIMGLRIPYHSFLCCFILVGTSVSVSSVQAENTVVEDKSIVVDEERFREIASELRCPTCTGLGVLDSEAPFSIQIRNEVRSQLAKGGDKKSILNFFLDRYGPWILRSPPKAGINWFAWLLPLGLLVFGPLVIYFMLFRRNPIVSTDSVKSSDEILQEMQAEIAKMKGSK